MEARLITTPFGLYDCDVPCDAAIAVIVSARRSVAPDLPKPAIRIEAAGTQITERLSWDQDTVTHEPQVIGPSTHLWTRTELTPDDVDLALLYDGFTFNAITWIEALGFCGFGEAKDWIDGGRTIALDGRLPLNPHGGQLSEGRTHGMGFFYEAVTQLRHEAGERQVGERRHGGRRHRRRHAVRRGAPATRRGLRPPDSPAAMVRSRGSPGAGSSSSTAPASTAPVRTSACEHVDEVLDVDQRQRHVAAPDPVAGHLASERAVPVDVEVRSARRPRRRRTRRS